MYTCKGYIELLLLFAPMTIMKQTIRPANESIGRHCAGRAVASNRFISRTSHPAQDALAHVIHETQEPNTENSNWIQHRKGAARAAVTVSLIYRAPRDYHQIGQRHETTTTTAVA